MDSKQNKWAGQILTLFEKNYGGALDINLDNIRLNILEEHTKSWMKSALKKYICSNPNMFARNNFASERELRTYLCQFFDNYHIPSTDYTIEIDRTVPNLDLAKLTFRNRKFELSFFAKKSPVIYLRIPDLNPEVRIGGRVYENYLSYKELNFGGLLNFMLRGLDELVEEIKFKKDFACNLWSRYSEVDSQTKMKSFSTCNLSFRKLQGQFFKEMERNRSRLIRIDPNWRLPIPTINGAERDPEGQFIKPFVDYYHEFCNPDVEITITKDTSCRGGFVVKVNDKTVYIKITDVNRDKYDYIYYQPDKINLYQKINNDMGSMASLVLYVYLGLKDIDKMISLYNELFLMYNQLPYNALMISLSESMPFQITEYFDAVPSIMYGPMCRDDFQMNWIADYESYVQFYQKVSEELAKRGHKVSFEEQGGTKEPEKIMKLTLDGAVITISILLYQIGIVTNINYQGAYFIKAMPFPLANINWMADFMEAMPAFYHKVFR